MEPEWNQDGNLNGNLNGNLDGNLGGNLDGNLNENLNGNLDGNLDGNMERMVNGSQPSTKLGPNLDQRGVLACLWRVLGDPWVGWWGFRRGPLGTKLGPRTGLAPVQHWGPKKCQM